MPESRQRHKKSSRRYQLEPQQKTRSKSSPRWFGPLVLGIMALGVVVIVWNYLRGDTASNGVLFIGLGLIAAGFLGTSFWK
jgi:hypothetical protein